MKILTLMSILMVFLYSSNQIATHDHVSSVDVGMLVYSICLLSLFIMDKLPFDSNKNE